MSFLTEIGLEIITLCGMEVAAVTNSQPLELQMQDAGYLALEPITVEVLKGAASSKETVNVDGKISAADLRGKIPVKNSPIYVATVPQCVIGGAVRRIDTVANQGPRWLITTLLANE